MFYFKLPPFFLFRCTGGLFPWLKCFSLWFKIALKKNGSFHYQWLGEQTLLTKIEVVGFSGLKP